MSNTLSPRTRNIETLETRQLFAAQPFATLVSRGPMPYGGMGGSDAVFVNRGMTADFVAALAAQFSMIRAAEAQYAAAQAAAQSASAQLASAQLGNASSDSSVAQSSVASQGSSTFSTATSTQLQSQPAPKSTLSIAAAQNASPTPAAVALLSVDGNTADSKADAKPAAAVEAITIAPKTFAERPLTMNAAAAAAPVKTNSAFAELLALKSGIATTAWQPQDVRLRHVSADVVAEQSTDQAAPIGKQQGPAAQTLAAVPTGSLIAQPFWQRVSAVSATVVILTANWMLRRKRKDVLTKRAA